MANSTQPHLDELVESTSKEGRLKLEQSEAERPPAPQPELHAGGSRRDPLAAAGERPDTLSAMAIGEKQTPLPPPAPLSSLEWARSPVAEPEQRVSMELGMRDEAPPASPLEGYGRPTDDPRHRIDPHQPVAGEEPSPLEAAGHPKEEAAVRKDPAAPLVGPPSPVEPYGHPNDRPEGRLNSVAQQLARGIGGPLDAYGQPLMESSERVDLLVGFLATPSGSPLEAYGRPSDDSEHRVVLPPEAPKPKGASPLEGLSRPAQDSAQRLVAGNEAWTQVPSSSLESYGQPNPDAGNRMILPPEVPRVLGVGTAELFGRPTNDANLRVALRPEDEEKDLPPSTLESMGDPSVDSEDRMEIKLSEGRNRGGRSLRALGEPSQQAEDRIDVWSRAPLQLPASTLEDFGAPAMEAKERLTLRPEEEGAERPPSTLEDYGEPAVDAGARVEITADSRTRELPPSTLEQYGTPGAEGGARMGTAEEDLVPVRASTMDGLGEMSWAPDQRLELGNRPAGDAPPSTLEEIDRTSDDRFARVALSRGQSAMDGAPSTLNILDELLAEAEQRVPLLGGSSSGSERAPSPLELYGDPRGSSSDRIYFDGRAGYAIPPSTLDQVPIYSRDADERIRSREAEPSGTGAGSGLEGLLSVPVLTRDQARRAGVRPSPAPPPRPEETPAPVLRSVDHPRHGLPTCPRCGAEVELEGEVPARRLDFAWQQFRRLRYWSERGRCLRCGLQPIERPRFHARSGRIADGLLAQIAVARFGDHLPLPYLTRLLERYGLQLTVGELCEELSQLRTIIGPVVEQMQQEVASSGSCEEDRDPIRVLEPVKGRPRKGALHGLRNARHTVFAFVPEGQEGVGLSAFQGRRPGPALGRELYLEVLGRSPSGRYAQMRQRFLMALPVDHEQAGWGLHLTLQVEAAGEGGAEARQALFAWLADQRDRFDEPTNGFQQSVVQALAHHAMMSEAARPPGSGDLARTAPKEWLMDPGEGGLQSWITFGSAFASCRQHGLRPWWWLASTLQRLHQGGSSPADLSPWSIAATPGAQRIG